MRPIRLVICLVSIVRVALCAGPPEKYTPGQHVTWDQFQELGKTVHEIWQETGGGEKELTALNDAVEPEALHAFVTLLRSKETKVAYGSFTPVESPREGETQFSPSRDGMMGLRIIRQLEVPHPKKGPRLISAIATYDYDFEKQKLVLRNGPDTVRIRVEVNPFVAEDIERKIRVEGFVGFSWVLETNREGQVSSVRSESYFDDSLAKSSSIHGKVRFKEVTFCGFIHHCNVCHHRKVRSAVKKEDFEAPEKSEGLKNFLAYVERDPRMFHEGKALETLKAQLKEPSKIDTSDLATALSKRWDQLKKK